MNDLTAFLNEQQERVEDLEKESVAAYWDAAVNGDPDAERRAAVLQAQLDICYSDALRFQALKAMPVPDDPGLRRQRSLLIDNFARNQMPHDAIRELNERAMKIESLFSNFRASLNGQQVTDNDLKITMRDSSDSETRKAAWEASKSIGAEAEQAILELVALRNREARALGYPDYYVMQIRLQELDEGTLFQILEDVSRQIEPLFAGYKKELDDELAKRFRIEPERLRPWHYADPFFQDAPAGDTSLDSVFEDKDLEKIASQFYRSIGLPIDHLLPKGDLYERPGKTQHAFCLSVGRGTGDVRVACNLRPDASWMGTLLHEYGHAVYDDLIDRSLPYFLRTVAHTMTTEAIAEMMGRLVQNGDWLRRYAAVPAGRAAEIEAAARQSYRAHLLVFTQWVQVMTHFERELYARPDQDLNRLWWDLVERCQRLTRPEARNAPDWAAKIHLAAAPVYYHNYLLGEMTASQILHALATGPLQGESRRLVDDPEVGRWLAENIFRPGALYSWSELLARATGEPLNAAYFVQELI